MTSPMTIAADISAGPAWLHIAVMIVAVLVLAHSLIGRSH